MCQMQKPKIEVRADLVIHAKTYKAAQLEVKDGHDSLSNITNNNGQPKINFLNMGLVKFGI